MGLGEMFPDGGWKPSAASIAWLALESRHHN